MILRQSLLIKKLYHIHLPLSILCIDCLLKIETYNLMLLAILLYLADGWPDDGEHMVDVSIKSSDVNDIY